MSKCTRQTILSLWHRFVSLPLSELILWHVGCADLDGELKEFGGFVTGPSETLVLGQPEGSFAELLLGELWCLGPTGAVEHGFAVEFPLYIGEEVFQR